MIWEAAPEPRALCQHGSFRFAKFGSGIPAIFGACRESRFYAKKMYKERRIVGQKKKTVVWEFFNSDIDFAFIEMSWHSVRPGSTVGTLWCPSPLFRRATIRRIIIPRCLGGILPEYAQLEICRKPIPSIAYRLRDCPKLEDVWFLWMANYRFPRRYKNGDRHYDPYNMWCIRGFHIDPVPNLDSRRKFQWTRSIGLGLEFCVWSKTGEIWMRPLSRIDQVTGERVENRKLQDMAGLWDDL